MRESMTDREQSHVDFDALRRAIRALRASGDLGYIDVERSSRDDDWVENVAHVIEAYERAKEHP